MHYNSVLRFWFVELQPGQWWAKSSDLDNLIARRFKKIHSQAAQGELVKWRETPEGCLAEVIILDQFSRNIYRDTPRAFQYDALALILAQSAINRNYDQLLSPEQRAFLYLPFMHSESLVIHRQAVRLFSQAGMEHNLEFEYLHKAIIDRFGRYPHRNKILGRVSSPEEESFLLEPNSSF